MRAFFREDSTPIDRARVLVVGAGPAGATVALSLARRGVDVLLLAGGGGGESQDSEGPWGHEPIDENRRFGLGGTSVAWGGRCVALDPIDFEKRDWIADSGWPISYLEYKVWWQSASDFLDIARPNFKAEPDAEIIPGESKLSGGRLSLESIERWSPPTNFSHALLRAQKDGSLRIRTDITIESFSFAASGIVTRANGSFDSGATGWIRADQYVLAAGTIESTRILLNSGLDQSLPAIGKFYMSHTFTNPIALTTTSGLSKTANFYRDQGVYVRNRWRLDDATQRDEQVGNGVVIVARPSHAGIAQHHSPEAAAVELGKYWKAKLQASAMEKASIPITRQAELALAVIGGGPQVWFNLASSAVARTQKRRLPVILAPHYRKTQHVVVQGEHSPRWDSRIDIVPQTGREKSPVRIRTDFGRLEFETVRSCISALADQIRPLGASIDRLPESATSDYASHIYGSFNSNAHQLGTLRMGTNLKRSVADADCFLHGSNNLSIAGGAVFPTSGHANPTFTIVALASRLAAEIHKRIQTR